MPQFTCRVLTPQGQIIRSKVEESSRLACIRRLRKNGLTPISVSRSLTLTNNQKNNKNSNKMRNVKPIDFKAKAKTRVKSKDKNKNIKTQGGFWDILNMDLGVGGKKPTARDIRVFTQNFYLLKKANFNNIHALSTVIETTENPRLKIILEDILAGVENRRIYVYNNGILF